MSSRLMSSADINAVIALVTPDVLALLADGVPRNKTTILAVLADRHSKDDVRRMLMRLAVTEQLVETGGKDTLPAAEAGQGTRRDYGRLDEPRLSTICSSACHAQAVVASRKLEMAGDFFTAAPPASRCWVPSACPPRPAGRRAGSSGAIFP
jgi:hypothetical protein